MELCEKWEEDEEITWEGMSSRSHVEVVEMKVEKKSENYLGLELTEVNRCEG